MQMVAPRGPPALVANCGPFRRKNLLPLEQATDGTYDPATGTLFFVRLPKQGSATKRYHGGWVDVALMRFTDVMMAIPALLLALALTGRDFGWNRASGGALFIRHEYRDDEK